MDMENALKDGWVRALILLFYYFQSCIGYTIYTTERPPFSWSGIIDANNLLFPNAYEPKCDIVAICFMKTNEKAEIISKDIIKAQGDHGYKGCK